MFYSGCFRRVELKLEHGEKPLDRSACCEEAIADSLECGGCVLFLHREFSPVCELRGWWLILSSITCNLDFQTGCHTEPRAHGLVRLACLHSHRFWPPPPCLAFTWVLGSEFRSSCLCSGYSPQSRLLSVLFGRSAWLMRWRKLENSKEPLLFSRPGLFFFKDSYFLIF